MQAKIFQLFFTKLITLFYIFPIVDRTINFYDQL